jgi:hypothetical protein
MLTWLQSEINGSRQDFHNWQGRMARRRRGLADLLAGRPTTERSEMIGTLRFLAIVGVTYLCLYLVGHLIPVGFDWKCCYGPRNLPPFFMPWTNFVLDLVNPPALFAFMILAIILRVRQYRGPVWAIALASLSFPVLWVLFKVDLEGVILLGIIMLPIGVPLALLKPQLAAFALLAKRSSFIAGVVWILLSFVLWGFWPLTFIGIGTPQWHAEWPQDISLFPWGAIIALPLLWLGRGDEDMLMAAGSFITPHVFPYHFALIMPAIARMSKFWAILTWLVSFSPLLANYLGPAAWHFGNLIGLVIWLGLYMKRRKQSLTTQPVALGARS